MTRHALPDPDLSLDDLIRDRPEVVPVLLRFELLCVGCLVAPFHTLADACAEHDVEEEVLMAALADVLSRPPPVLR
ncbi:DUF1858 domain-containing protein [Oceanomicrobium pacificus]|uniref:DUF1858 domain-containing protein n=1 Tax=Oceanomicrobium pacificus TaxID=2692916 RepID=A0A6B0TPM8_9RHOB|nr:DUF1858 domain-containing protein [Oceanomicrobium pacificus]MXU66557.1 DUF1858 domain-containing protein [Oceanomicrobium pacificus]